MNKKVMENYAELGRNLGLRQESDGVALYGKCGAYDVIVYPAIPTIPICPPYPWALDAAPEQWARISARHS